MIHNDIQNQLQLLIKTSAQPLVEVADHSVGSPQWTPGQQIPAHVLASLPNGRFQVQVGDQILDLNLPRNTQPGDALELTYVSNAPRLTFALTQQAAVQGLLPNSIQSSGVSLSDTAKLVGTLAREPATAASATSQTSKTAPVINVGPTDVPAMAQALKTSVAQSGLFYESHQMQWLSGDRPLAALRQEPQGQLAPLVQPRLPRVGQTMGHAAAALPELDQPAAKANTLLNSRAGNPAQSAALSTPAAPDSPREIQPRGTTAASVINGNPATSEPESAPPQALPPTPGPSLKTSITQSGLIYETQHMPWPTGDRPLAALAPEPQRQLPPLATPLLPAAGSVPSPVATTAALPPGDQPVTPQNTILNSKTENPPQSAALRTPVAPESPREIQPRGTAASSVLNGNPATGKPESVHPQALPPAPAPALKTSITQSGLTYETQRMPWPTGDRSLAALPPESQAQLPPLGTLRLPEAGRALAPIAAGAGFPQPAQSARAVNAPSNSNPETPVSAVELRLPDASGNSIEDLPRVAGTTAASNGNPDTAKPESVHPQALPLVQQQLHALDTRQVVWQGEVWPGQLMHWEIEEELAGQAGRHDDEETSSWNTHLNLQLPALGGVHAKLAFVNGTVRLDIASDNDESTALMQQRQVELAERFDAAGLQLAGLVIRHE